jgi:hypothetical protein
MCALASMMLAGVPVAVADVLELARLVPDAGFVATAQRLENAGDGGSGPVSKSAWGPHIRGQRGGGLQPMTAALDVEETSRRGIKHA